MDAAMPVLYPASGRSSSSGCYAIALSRFAGLWVGIKMRRRHHGRVDDGRCSPATRAIRDPQDFHAPRAGSHARGPTDRCRQEERLHRHKLPAAIAFARANGIDRVVFAGRHAARLGIAAAGKAYLAVRQALRMLGDRRCGARASMGVRVCKLGMAWPVEAEASRALRRRRAKTSS